MSNRKIGGLVSVTYHPHLELAGAVVPPAPEGCEECLRLGTPWVHLRLRLTCRHAGCCDSSPERHPRIHANHIGHAGHFG